MNLRENKWVLFLNLLTNMVLLHEPLFDFVHVKDTLTLTLKNKIFVVLSSYCLDIFPTPIEGWRNV